MLMKKGLSNLLTLKEVCEILKVHPNTLRIWDKKGVLKSVRFGVRKDRHYRKEDVMRLLNEKNKNNALQIQEESVGYTMRLTKAELALDRLSRLQQVTAALSRALTSSDVLNTILSQSIRSINCDRVLILKKNAQFDILEARGYTAKDIQLIKKILKNTSNPFFDVASSSEPIFIESEREFYVLYPDYKKEVTSFKEFSLAVIPLIVVGETIGVLAFSFVNPYTFTKDDSSYLLALATHCAQALERAQLYEKESQARHQAEMMEKTIKSFYTSSLKFLLPLTKEETYKTIVEEAMSLVKAEYGSILLATDGELERVYASSPILYQIKARKQGRTYKAFREQKASVYRVKSKNDPHPLRVKLGIKSVVYIPLSYEGKILGVLTLLSSKKESFSEQEFTILQLFGSMASLSIRKTQLYSNTLQALETRDLFISMASHELRTPLTIINGYAQLIRQKYLDKTTLRLEWIEKLCGEVVRLEHLIIELLHIDKIKKGRLDYKWQRCSLKALIQQVITDFKLVYPTYDIQFEDNLDGNSDIVLADPNKLVQAFYNVLNNAIKFAVDTPHITVELKSHLQHIILSIKDNGQGILEEDIQKIFDKFYQGENHVKEGMGLGLFLVENIIKHHQGQVSVSSQESKGTTVEINLPLIKNA